MSDNAPSGMRRSLTSTTTSAGRPARAAAVLMASGDGASYRQYVFRLSADRNEYIQRTPSWSLIRLMPSAASTLGSSSSAKLRSTMNMGTADSSNCLGVNLRREDSSRSGIGRVRGGRIYGSGLDLLLSGMARRLSAHAAGFHAQFVQALERGLNGLSR